MNYRSHLNDVLGGEGVGSQAVQVLGVGLEDGSDVRLPLLVVHGVEVGLELGGLLLGPPPGVLLFWE